jgi:MFS family permease
VALTLAVAMFVLPLGMAADLLGHVVVFRMGLFLAVAGFALASLSPNFLLLCGALAVGGVGLAAVFGSNNALLFQAVAPDRRASAVGINSMCIWGFSRGRFWAVSWPRSAGGLRFYCLGAIFGVGCSGWRPLRAAGTWRGEF